jgi:hypothetical protein
MLVYTFTVYKMSALEIIIDKMPIVEMILDKMTCNQREKYERNLFQPNICITGILLGSKINIEKNLHDPSVIVKTFFIVIDAHKNKLGCLLLVSLFSLVW